MGLRLFEPAEPSSGAGGGETPATEPSASTEAEPTISTTAAPSGPLSRVRLLVAYDGGAFRGFAFQPDVPTVAGRLMEALERVVGHPVVLTCAGRTDAGVHAAGQVVHVDVDDARLGLFEDADRVARSLTHQVGPDVAVLDVAVAERGFDARRSALARRYRYLILATPRPDPLLRHLTWHVAGELDLPAMRLAADVLLGEHDFAAFCRKPQDGGSTVRRVTESAIGGLSADQRLLRYKIEANAFCHQMVRSIVGALVSVGEGRLTAAGVLELLRSGDRSRGSRLAPPEGLCLELVRYPPELIDGGVWAPGLLPAGVPA